MSGPRRDHQSWFPFIKTRKKMVIEAGCLLWGRKFIISKKLQARVFQELYVSHRMKGLAKEHVRWPELNTEIENEHRD